MSGQLIVRGNPTTEELAAALAVLRRDMRSVAPQRGQDQNGYARWRRIRLAALRSAR